MTAIDGQAVYLELIQAAATRHIGGFLQRVLGRLEVGRREYGNSALQRPLEELLLEMREECEDIAGWGAQAHQVLQSTPMPPAARDQVQQLIVLAGELASVTDEILTSAIEEVQRVRAGP